MFVVIAVLGREEGVAGTSWRRALYTLQGGRNKKKKKKKKKKKMGPGGQKETVFVILLNLSSASSSSSVKMKSTREAVAALCVAARQPRGSF